MQVKFAGNHCVIPPSPQGPAAITQAAGDSEVDSFVSTRTPEDSQDRDDVGDPTFDDGDGDSCDTDDEGPPPLVEDLQGAFPEGHPLRLVDFTPAFRQFQLTINTGRQWPGDVQGSLNHQCTF